VQVEGALVEIRAPESTELQTLEAAVVEVLGLVQSGMLAATVVLES
jgi:hypothetical protein